MNEWGEHSNLDLVLALIALGLVAGGLWWALVTDVTVSPLWPLGATAGMIGVGYLYLGTRHTLRTCNHLMPAAAGRGRKAMDAFLRRPEEGQSAPDVPASEAG